MKKIVSRYAEVGEPASFSSPSKLSNYVKSSRKDIEKSLLGEDAFTLHRPFRKKFDRRPVIVGGMNEQFQMDLLDVSPLKKENQKTTFLLTCIDVFSKVAWVIPLKSKTSGEVFEAMKEIFTSIDSLPRYVQTDRGMEFLNAKVQGYLNSLGVSHFYTYNDETKASVVERFNRTFKLKLWRYLTFNNTKKYIDVLSELVKSYNETYHRTIGMAPNEVNMENSEQVWWNIERRIPQQRGSIAQCRVGDYVRIIMKTKTFRKETESAWSEELFLIHEVLLSTPTTYRLSDLKGEVLAGTFYEKEVQKVHAPQDKVYKIEKVIKHRGKGGKREVLVKWRGYPDSFNSWIAHSSIQKI